MSENCIRYIERESNLRVYSVRTESFTAFLSQEKKEKRERMNAIKIVWYLYVKLMLLNKSIQFSFQNCQKK